MFKKDTYYCLDFVGAIHVVDEIDREKPWQAIWYCDSRGSVKVITATKKIKVKYNFPVYFEVEVSGDELDKIHEGDEQTIIRVRERIKNDGDYYYTTSPPKLEIDCDEPNLNT